jgi:hypothetical protein
MLIFDLLHQTVGALAGTGLLEALALHLYHTGLYLTALAGERRRG